MPLERTSGRRKARALVGPTDMAFAEHDFHRGLMAALNDAFHQAHDDDPADLRFYRRVIERSGQPVLDAGCGAGRLVLGLLRDGVDADGSDVSPDMLDLCRKNAAEQGLSPTLYEATTAALEPSRRYRTIVLNGSLGLNGTRTDDVAALRRVHQLLEPGGTLAFDVGPGWRDPDVWARAAQPDRLLPTPWTPPSATPTPDGGEIVDSERLVSVDPLEQSYVKDLWLDLVRGGHVVASEHHRLVARWYHPHELVAVLDSCGFGDVRVFGDFTDEPVAPSHEAHVYVATKDGTDH